LEKKNREVQTVHIAGSVWVSILENAISIAVTFGVLWILSAEAYGIVKITENTVAAILVFSNLGFALALTHFTAKSLEDDNYGNPMMYLLAASLLMVMAFILITIFTPLILVQLSLESYFGIDYLLCSGGFLFASLALFVQNFLKGMHEYGRSLYSRLLQTAVRFIVIPLSLLLAAFGYFIGIFIAGFVAFAFSLFYVTRISKEIRRPIAFEWSEFKKIVRYLLSYSKKSFLSKLLRQIYFTAPIWILAGFSPVAVALFSVAFLLTRLVQLFPAAIRGYMMPTFTGFISRDNRKRIEIYYRNGIGAILAAVIPINLTMMFFPEAVILMLRPSYIAAIPHILPLALASIFFCMLTFDSVLFFSAGNVEYSVVVEVVVASVSILSALLLLPVLGETAVSWGLLIGIGLGWLIQHFIMKGIFKISFGVKLTSKAIILCLLTILTSLVHLYVANALGLGLTLIVIILLAGSSLALSGLLSISLSLVPRERIREMIYMVTKLNRGRK